MDVRRVGPLRRRHMAVLVRHRDLVLVPLAVQLRQDRGEANVAWARRQHRAAGRVEGAPSTGAHKRASFSSSTRKLACASGATRAGL